MSSDTPTEAMAPKLSQRRPGFAQALTLTCDTEPQTLAATMLSPGVAALKSGGERSPKSPPSALSQRRSGFRRDLTVQCDADGKPFMPTTPISANVEWRYDGEWTPAWAASTPEVHSARAFDLLRDHDAKSQGDAKSPSSTFVGDATPPHDARAAARRRAEASPRMLLSPTSFSEWSARMSATSPGSSTRTRGARGAFDAAPSLTSRSQDLDMYLSQVEE
eukprot:CAMPEP_0176253274 /NCGR_PEP_ID=MMETSP0121_2-20121125/35931_1 /TAXON_ID=160619 /ORGANISM="Kryptoperidinium foliaceum, Strain CCMP 1326" /LENGTH=219 /DNA_ID=CAMNT_0017593045 /DNA_START=26 /DNA_END=685 /DNA_ORIENTATION=+